MDMEKKNLIAQWAFDCRPVLGRFHLWLVDVEESWSKGEPEKGFSFVPQGLEKAFIMALAVTALGTRLFGKYGEGKGKDKAQVNRIKKDADAMSAYALSEALWHLTRGLPENHAVMVSIGEGLMPKGGETPDMGANPLLGFGRVYARPQVARFLDRRVSWLINDPNFTWDDFYQHIRAAGITVWGAAVDTLENTTRFAMGEPTGPLSVFHLFDQPLRISRPYEGYMGTLILPKKVVETAAFDSILINYHTPREIVFKAIRKTYPQIPPERIHVWTLGGQNRAQRIGTLWEQWRALGVHVCEDGYLLPWTGLRVFTDSGTYAPVFAVGVHKDKEGNDHLFITDGYAATAEALQAASLDPILGIHTCLCLFTSSFKVSWEHEKEIMSLKPDDPDFKKSLSNILGREVSEEEALEFKNILLEAKFANMPLGKRTVTVDDFFPEKMWRVLAVVSYILQDPYSGSAGVEQVDEETYRVTTRAATESGLLETRITLRLMEPFEEMRLVFSPLLDRFYAGADYKTRAVKVSDSGRIRNELQTLAPTGLIYLGDGRIKVDLDRVDDKVLPKDKKELIMEVLRWYKANHPLWFSWLVID